MPLISRFDPWSNGMCICPPKLTFNPYTGCDHDCLYCYATSYVSNFHRCRPKVDLLRKLGKEAIKLHGQIVSMSASSDPYPTIETSQGLTRKCLSILSRSNCKIQVTTKSNIVARDADLLSKVPSTVAFTITTDNDALAKRLEPNAPSATERIRTAQILISKGVPVMVRIDPIIPSINECPKSLVAALASIGVKQVTSSTYKPKPDNWHRLSATIPDVAKKLRPLYYEQGERLGGNTFLPKELRFNLLKGMRDLVMASGMKFGVCREGLSELGTARCDGSWMFSANGGERLCQPKLLE